MATATLPRKRRKEARPSELTAAALGLFVEKGFAATRLEAVSYTHLTLPTSDLV